MNRLPDIMVAPNGATRTKSDHPMLPVTDDEIVECAKACAKAGADAMHFHLRDAQQRHVLDADRCQTLCERLNTEVPEMLLQVTSEAAGIYSAGEQIAFIQALKPKFVSIGLREIERLEDEAKFAEFYQWVFDQNIWVQHILYDADDFVRLEDYSNREIINDSRCLLFVCGRYRKDQNSTQSDLEPFLNSMEKSRNDYDWAACAFGAGETKVLEAAREAGGKIRVGFENSLWNEDGKLAKDNAERVSILARG